MANMAVEKKSTIQDSPRDKWVVTDEVREVLRMGKEDYLKMKAEFEKSTPPCPIDGIPGKFQGYEGAYTRVRGVFLCEKGHKFFQG